MSGSSASGDGDFERILVAVDGSEHAFRAARVATDLAKRSGAELYILNVITTPSFGGSTSGGGIAVNLEEYWKVTRADSTKMLDDLKDAAEKAGVSGTTTKIIDNVFSSVLAITRYAEENKIDLVVMGTRGLGGFKAMLLGSVSSGVLSHAHCSVLLVR